MLIGLAGKKGSGKSTVAAHLLHSALGARSYSFAAPLKRLVGDTYDLSHEQLYGDKKEVIDPRYGKSARQILQEVGVHLRQYDSEIWVRPVAPLASHPGLVVIDDVRFPTEVEAIRKAGGAVIHVDRPGTGGDSHISENALQGIVFDGKILNIGTIENLYIDAEDICQEFISQGQ